MKILILTSLKQDVDVDELREELPEHQPRFVVFSFKLDHGDGRISYPMCFIFSSPKGYPLTADTTASTSHEFFRPQTQRQSCR